MTDLLIVDLVSDQVDGNWANWRSWKSCTRTCGKGSRYRLRTCASPAPSNRGKHCVGSAVQGEHCNQKECPDSSQ